MSQIREEVSFTKGRIIVRGKLVSRGKAKRADSGTSPKKKRLRRRTPCQRWRPVSQDDA